MSLAVFSVELRTDGPTREGSGSLLGKTKRLYAAVRLRDESLGMSITGREQPVKKYEVER